MLLASDAAIVSKKNASETRAFGLARARGESELIGGITRVSPDYVPSALISAVEGFPRRARLIKRRRRRSMSLDNLRTASTLDCLTNRHGSRIPIDRRLWSPSCQLRAGSAFTTAIFGNDRANRNDY